VFSLSVQEDGYMLVVVSGQGRFGTYRAVLTFIGELITGENEHRVLIDMLASEPKMSADEHHTLGKYLALISKGVQIAVVVPSTERVFIGEQAAQSAGGNIKTFTNLHDAGDWLNVKR
jgi:hypothetical protein